MMHDLKLYSENFDRIKSGFKTREYRLYDEKRRLINELCKLKMIKNTNEGGLIDKCIHFKANYKPIFQCCNQVYPCYICHDERETHTYIFSEKVLCLVCGNIYEGMQCNKCFTKQLYIKK